MRVSEKRGMKMLTTILVVTVLLAGCSNYNPDSAAQAKGRPIEVTEKNESIMRKENEENINDTYPDRPDYGFQHRQIRAH
jgi:PBP1b-binding outer membrane lipoprotein LpoB